MPRGLPQMLRQNGNCLKENLLALCAASRSAPEKRCGPWPDQMSSQTAAVRPLVGSLLPVRIKLNNTFTNRVEAQQQLKSWRREYNPRRPCSSLGHRAPTEVDNIMFKTVREVLGAPVHWLRRRETKQAVSSLKSHADPKARAIADALDDTITGRLPHIEQDLIASIEYRRSSLLNSDAEILVIDYGAGDPDSNRTKAEMEQGVQSLVRVSDVCGGSQSAFWATLLFRLVRRLQPRNCVELGTCVGITASFIASALKVNGGGTLWTLEGSPENARIGRETLDSLGLRNAHVVMGPFHETLRGVMESAKPIDFFFNDGHHDRDAVMGYFCEALPHLASDAVVVFDDISWSPGMREAWVEITRHDRVRLSIDLGLIGVVLIGPESFAKVNHRILLRQ